ncbi:phosphate acyltransferase [Ancylobacter defluvii]|uniref:Malic enzyme N-terminal domain-containing protein n=1 Tax=Ancylobacter defluvii TaxID=1282440 RepID=A0A9W6JUM4_9HYPH|nr:phosphate acyltransferase [Ancylobacter defluvii]MBS7590207.1 hypothetical protein [Ancylobacter defluvii]GLK82848.1 hypothetical protein GCM10017653_09170 [Ancylobacter defluvii]
MIADFRQTAPDYHRHPQPGKLGIRTTKRMETQRDLAFAYSPGVAAPCEAIAADPRAARDYTARGNLVGVITNGTAVLGLGNVGPLASKPAMEGKSVLFKKFAGIGAFDIEGDTSDVARFCDAVALLEPSCDSESLTVLPDRCVALVERRGVPPTAARRRLRQQPTVAEAMLLKAGLVDAALCGTPADWSQETRLALDIIPRTEGITRVSSLTALITSRGVMNMTALVVTESASDRKGIHP